MFNTIFSKAQDLSQTRAKIEKLFLRELRQKSIHNAFLQVSSPTLQVDWNFAGGEFASGKKVSDKNPFLTASIGKTFTATAIAILAEQCRVDFNHYINQYLSEDIMDGLHVYEGTDYSHEITLAHLLQHTSGLPDCFEDTTLDGGKNLIQQLLSNPGKYWEPEEAIRLAKEKMRPHFAPGKGYHYTDTEYMLLGLIIEKVTSQALADYFKAVFFEPLRMNATAMHLRSESLQPTGPLAEIYVGHQEISGYTSLSADWAGGGLSSTADDLNNFQKALHSGQLVSLATIDLMQQWTPESKGMYYGFGLRKFVFNELFPLLPRLEIIGHSGSTGSFMYYCPQLDVYLSGTFNQTEAVKKSIVLLVKVLSEMKKHQPHIKN